MLCVHTELEAEHSTDQHPYSTLIHLYMDYKTAAGCSGLDKRVTGKTPKASEDPSVCDYSPTPEQKCCTDSPASSASPGREGCAPVGHPGSGAVLCTPTNAFLSCTKASGAVLKHLIAMQGCKGLLNKISPSGLFF